MSRRDEVRFQALRASLAELGYFRRGSVQRRFMPCGRSGCRCQANPPKLHGPYYQWTRKAKRKTVTVRLTPQQATLMRDWIANARRLRRIVAELERVSLRLTAQLFDAAGKPGSRR
jgi:hypothetical protein